MNRKSILNVPDLEADKVLDRIVEKTCSCGGCLLWTGNKVSGGYGIISYKGQRYRVTGVLYEILNGPIDPDLDILHTCDNPACVRLDHLKVGTHAENMADCKNKDRQAKGQRNGHAKLTPEKIEEIRRKRQEGKPIAEVALEYGVSKATVSNVTKGTRWQHLNLAPLSLPSGPRGESHGQSKLNPQQVREIRHRGANGETYASIARAFSISAETASRIVKRIIWKSVP